MPRIVLEECEAGRRKLGVASPQIKQSDHGHGDKKILGDSCMALTSTSLFGRVRDSEAGKRRVLHKAWSSLVTGLSAEGIHLSSG